jgi:hypothetical protein
MSLVFDGKIIRLAACAGVSLDCRQVKTPATERFDLPQLPETVKRSPNPPRSGLPVLVLSQIRADRLDIAGEPTRIVG